MFSTLLATLALLGAQTTSAAGDWEAVGHAAPSPWLPWLGSLAVLLFFAWFLLLLVRGALRHGRYRAVAVLTAQDASDIHEAIAAAEKRTVGEIVPVIVERSDRHPGAYWLAALFAVLLFSALLAAWLPWEVPFLLLACQALFGPAGYGLAVLLPGYRRAFISEARATEMAEEQAFQEFYRHGLHRTQAQTGVLLFISLLEHRAIVIADEGIDAKVEPDRWTRTNDAILDGIRAGSLRNGVVAGIESAAEVLEEFFPWEEGDRNEISDRVIIRRE